MGEHAPEAQHRRGSHIDAELRQVQLYVAGDCPESPREAVLIRCGKERTWIAAARSEAIGGSVAGRFGFQEWPLLGRRCGHRARQRISNSMRVRSDEFSQTVALTPVAPWC